MQFEQMCEFPHLARLQMRLAVEAAKKRTDRELREQFGNIEEQENEAIWKLEQISRGVNV